MFTLGKGVFALKRGRLLQQGRGVVHAEQLFAHLTEQKRSASETPHTYEYRYM